MKMNLRKILSLMLACLLLLQLPVVGGVQATEVSAQSGDALYDTVAEQVRAFAKSINQSDADDTAATALAKHGISGGGKKLSVGKSHALTATIWNSLLFQQALIESCTVAIQTMQQADISVIKGAQGLLGWYEERYRYYVYTQADPDISTIYWDWKLCYNKNYTGKTNSYDSSLNWIAAASDLLLTMERIKVTDTAVTYRVTCSVGDRFDFNTSSNSGFKNLISGLGALLFKEFDWETTASLDLTVPYSCNHNSGAYHLMYDQGSNTLTAETGNGYLGNAVSRHTHQSNAGVTVYYYELGETIRLRHDKPWVIEYDVTGNQRIALTPFQNTNAVTQPMLVQNTGRELFFVSGNYNHLIDANYYDYYGLKLSNLYSYSPNQPYTFRLENQINKNGSNMILLTVSKSDTGEILIDHIPTDDHYAEDGNSGTMNFVGESSDWLVGKDFYINFVGNTTCSFVASKLDLRIWENGIDGGEGDCFADKVTKPTCSAKGYTTRTCACCGYSYKTDYTNKTSHKYTDVVTASTCTAQGYTTHTCSVCGDSYSDTYVDAVGHQYQTEVVAPTCTESGYTVYTCELCGFESIADYVDPLDHSTVILEAVAPSCTEDGLTEGSYCEACGEVFAEQTVIGATGHELTDWRIEEKPTCTEEGLRKLPCNRCDYYETEPIPATGHDYESVVTAPTCTTRGYTTHTCSCGDSYVDSDVLAMGHSFGQWALVTEPNPGQAGQERRDCDRCDHFETRSVAYQGNALVLTGEDLTKQKEVWIEGMPYPVITAGDIKYVELPTEKDCILVTYTYQNANNPDIHTQYPTGMKVYKVSGGKITHIKELDNLLQYSGSSIRITGKKGIRMITSITKANKTALTGKGLAGYKLVEYGTALCWASKIKEGDALVLGKSFTRSNYAYKKGVADPIFASTKDLVQYTNVLVGFTNDQCKDDIAMRPYIILEDAKGEKITLYGGTIYRSIGYIAYQNRNVVKKGTEAYKYVWDIIHHVYGTKYDADYKG